MNKKFKYNPLGGSPYWDYLPDWIKKDLEESLISFEAKDFIEITFDIEYEVVESKPLCET